jgi:hypothetical protein
MTEKFTPGEWEISDMSGVDAMDNFTVCFHIGVSSTGEMIADIQSDNKTDYERVRANAHLIAAAPEMYKIIGWLGSVEGQCAILTKDSEIVRKAHAILKKARGEE